MKNHLSFFFFAIFRVYFPNQPWAGGGMGPPTLLGSNLDPNFPSVDYSNRIPIPLR